MADLTKLHFRTPQRRNLLATVALVVALVAPSFLAIAHALDLAPVSLELSLFIALVGLAGIAWLATERHRRLALISEAIDATDCAIVIYDGSDRLVLANRAYRDVLGVTEEDAVPGIHYNDLVRLSLARDLPPEEVESELTRRLGVQQRADGVPNDRIYTNNRWVRVSKTRLPSGLNIGIGVDVTDYYELKDQRDMEAGRFSALARGAPVGICQMDGHSEVQFLNDALLAMMGARDRDALLQREWKFQVKGTEVTTFAGLLEMLRADAAETEVKLDLDGTIRHLIVRKSFVPVVSSVDAEPGPHETTENLLIFVDITKRKAAEARVSYLALHDPLTDALNRVAFAEDLDQAASGADMNRPAALIAIDLDRFKPVNDVHGNAVADRLLCRVVERIDAAIPDQCRLYRIGGDEFAVLCPPPSGIDAMACAGIILDRLSEPFFIDGSRIAIGASVGVSLLPVDTDNPETLVRYADLALYQSKSRGGGSVHAFSPKILSSADTRRVMEFDLAEAVENGDIEIVMQPIFGTDPKRPVAAETLARWTNRRTGESVSPTKFIPIAEGTKLISLIDVFVLRRALRAYAQMREAGTSIDRLAVNVSMRTLELIDFAADVEAALERYGVPGSNIVLEVTENVLVEDVSRLAATMARISESGVRFAIDDFGTGYTSLRMLADLPVNYLKIDQSFVRSLTDPTTDRQYRIVSAIIEMATHLGLEVIAEGVESEEAYRVLQQLGCNLFQGYHLARPMPPEAIAGAGRGTAVA